MGDLYLTKSLPLNLTAVTIVGLGPALPPAEPVISAGRKGRRGAFSVSVPSVLSVAVPGVRIVASVRKLVTTPRSEPIKKPWKRYCPRLEI
jgi:hypothetical protein